MRFKYFGFSALWGFVTFGILFRMGYTRGTELALAVTLSLISMFALLYIIEDFLRGRKRKTDLFIKKKQEKLLYRYGGRVQIETLLSNGKNILVAYILKKDANYRDQSEEAEISDFLRDAFSGIGEIENIVVTSINTFSDIPRARFIIKNTSL